MNNSTKKEKWWLYSIFFLIGILSLPLSLYLGMLLASANILHLEGLFQLLFPLLICSILFAMVMYTFKERSFRFALKTFTISLIASVLIFIGGSFGVGLFIPAGLFLPLYPLFFLLIFSAIGLIAFKNRPLAIFTLKVFTISFFTVFLIVGAWFMWGALEHEYAKYIHIRKIDGMPSEHVNITEQELEEYPALKKALSGQDCERFSADSWGCKVHPDEWRTTLEFIEKKRHESGYLFSIVGMELEVELDKRSAVPTELRDIFESKGFPLSENALIHLVGERWDIVERQYLFSIRDAELEMELNKIEESKEARIPKLRNAFESNGVPLSENHRVLRMTENWIVIDEGGTPYEIWKEGGKLNVYTEERRPYEIWKEDGKLNVYDSRALYGSPIIKVGGNYYEIAFATA